MDYLTHLLDAAWSLRGVIAAFVILCLIAASLDWSGRNVDYWCARCLQYGDHTTEDHTFNH